MIIPKAAVLAAPRDLPQALGDRAAVREARGQQPDALLVGGQELLDLYYSIVYHCLFLFLSAKSHRTKDSDSCPLYIIVYHIRTY